MTDPQERIRDLERELRHATAIAACSIGQPDRAENVAYREQVRFKLDEARASSRTAEKDNQA